MTDRTITYRFAFRPQDRVRLADHDPKRHDNIVGRVVCVELAVRSISGDLVERVNVQWIDSDGSLGRNEWHEAWMLKPAEDQPTTP